MTDSPQASLPPQPPPSLVPSVRPSIFRSWAPWILGGLLVLVLVALLWLILLLEAGAHVVGDFLGIHRADSTVVTILRSEEMMFLVTDRIVTRVDVEINEDSLWAGGRQALLLATARMYVGIDLKHLSERSIHDEGNAIVVEVPKPTVLDFAVDTDWRYFDKRTGMWAISDWLNDRDVQVELRSQLRARAMDFVRKNQLMPDPEVELARLNRYAAVLAPRVGKPVEFRYGK